MEAKKNLPGYLFLLVAMAVAVTAMASAEKMSAEEMDWLASRSGYCEGMMSSVSGPLVLDEIQKTIMDDYSKIHATLKSRQVGYSFGPVAAGALAECMLIPRHLEIFVSVNKDDTFEKIRYARELYDSIPVRYRPKLETDNKTELAWSNGSRIVSMFRPRGKGPGNVRLDEFAYMQDPREVMRGALGVTSRGGQVIIGSTLKGNTGIPYEILTGDTNRAEFKRIKRHRVFWWQSSALCTDVKAATKPVDVGASKYVMAAELLSTPERIKKWASNDLKLIFSMMLLEDFQQEYELQPLEAEAAFISWELISACADREIEIYETYEALREVVRGELYVGVDIGRRKDATELFVFELVGGIYKQRMLRTFRKMEFERQKAELLAVLEILPIRKMAIDETGLGMNLAEDLQAIYPHLVEPVNFASRTEAAIMIGDKHGTVPVKERMATDVKIGMERRTVVIYRDPELMRQIFSIKRVTSAAGNIRYDAERNDQHHADKFWAMALALFASRSKEAPVMLIRPVFPNLGFRSEGEAMMISGAKLRMAA